jgi:hypothetical protein
MSMRVLICGGGVNGAAIAYLQSRRGVEAIFIHRPRLACAASAICGLSTRPISLRDPKRLRRSQIIECVEPSTRSSQPFDPTMLRTVSIGALDTPTPPAWRLGRAGAFLATFFVTTAQIDPR